MTKPKAGEPPTFEQALEALVDWTDLAYDPGVGPLREAHQRECRERTLEELNQIAQKHPGCCRHIVDEYRALAARKDDAPITPVRGKQNDLPKMWKQ